MTSGVGGILLNILVFTSAVFLRLPWLILLYNKLSTGTKDGLTIYCLVHWIKIWPPKNPPLLLLYFTSKLICKVTVLVNES